jgi:enoyl-CoA hydratase
MAYQNIILEIKDGIALLTINRPKAMNALNPDTIAELTAAVDEIAANKDVVGVILTGAGDKAFVAGADISEFPKMNKDQARQFAVAGHKLMASIEALPVIVIAAVNGFALGGGTELSLACDWIYASKAAKFGQPEVNLGIIPGFGGTVRLPRVVGPNMARELVCTGRVIDAAEALRIGLVNAVFEPEELMDKAVKAIKTIASKGPIAVKIGKRMVYQGMDVSLPQSCDLEIDAFVESFDTADRIEGATAFIEKRKAEFTGK